MKFIIVTIFIIVVLALIIAGIAISNFGLERIQEYVNNNATAEWAADWQWDIGSVYYYSFREERALSAFEIFIAKYPKDSRVPDAYYRKAVCLQEMTQRDKAIDAFNDFADKFPDHPDAMAARKRAAEIRYTH